jgi:hypothetical protein
VTSGPFYVSNYVVGEFCELTQNPSYFYRLSGPPTINHPADIEYEQGQIGNIIIWSPSDRNPSSYSIFHNGNNIMSGPWNISGETIYVWVDGLPLGVHNYTIRVTDTDELFVTDSVFVTVMVAVAPTVDHPADIEYEQGQTGNFITWHPSDTNPAAYFVLRDDSIFAFSLWNTSGEAIAVSADALSLGVHNFTIFVFDRLGLSANDTVCVNVKDTTNPTINHIEDFTFVIGQARDNLTWHPSELNPSSYQVLRNDVVIASGAWNSSLESISLSIGAWPAGTYNVTIVVTDLGGNSATDTVMITVVQPQMLNGLGIPIILGSLAVIVVFTVLILKNRSSAGSP